MIDTMISHCRIIGKPGWGVRLGMAGANALQAKNSTGRRCRRGTLPRTGCLQRLPHAWGDADPEIPIYRHTKAKYAKLQ
jgi:hypothetical protein